MNRIAASVLSILLLAGVGQAQNLVEEIVAWVNEDIILRSELEREKTALRESMQQSGLQGAQLEQAFNEQSRDLLRLIIDNTLLLQVARRLGLDAEAEVVRTLERLRQEQNELFQREGLEFRYNSIEELEEAMVAQGHDLEDVKKNIRTRHLTSTVIGREVSSRIIVTTEEARNHYEANRQSFDRPEGIRLQVVGVLTENLAPEQAAEKRQKIEEALAAVRRGEDFAQIALQYSELETALDGGHIPGLFQRGQQLPEIDSVLWALGRGQSTDILAMPWGLAVFKIVDKHSGGILPFELALEEIYQVIFEQRINPKIGEYLAKLRSDGLVRVKDGYQDTGAAQPASPSDSAAPTGD